MSTFINSFRFYGGDANTFIGGVSGVINTPALLAAKLSNYPSGIALDVSKIFGFTIVGSDIECYIGVDYQIKFNAFSGGAGVIQALTYYSDVGKFCKKIFNSAFNNQTTLTYVNLEALTSLPAQLFRSSGLTLAYFPEVLTLSSGATTSNFHFFGCASINSIYLPKCTVYGTNSSNVSQPTVDNQCFTNIKLNCAITVPTAMQTINAGGLEADLAYAQNIRSAVITYV